MNWHAWIVGAVLLCTAWAGRAAELMTFQEISLQVRMGEPPRAVLAETARRKLLEPLTGDQEEALKAAGVSAEVIEALRAPALLASPGEAAAYRARKEQIRKAVAQTAAKPAPSPAPAQSSGPVDSATLHAADIVKVGDRAPGFAATAVGGKEISLGSLKGRVTLVVIFAAWDAPCVQELAVIEKEVLPKLGPAGLAVVALGSGQNVQQLAAFKQANHFTFDLVEDPKKAINALYATDFIPRNYVVGKDGIVKYASAGLNKEDFQRMIQIILSELR